MPLFDTVATGIHRQKYRIALEEVERTFPSGSRNAAWWIGGTWHDIAPGGFQNFQDKQTLYFPDANAATIFSNNASPIVVRRWSEGTLAGPFEAGFGAVLLAAVLGASINTQEVVPDPNQILLTLEPINTNPKSLVLANQPQNGGTVIRFEMDYTSSIGVIGISGIDAWGNGASEQLDFTGSGTFYTRNSYSSIGASGIKITGVSDGSLTIAGVQAYRLSMSATSVPGTITVEETGNPTTTLAATRSFRYTGVAVRELTLETDPYLPDGLLTLNADLVGHFSNSCTTTEKNYNASMLRVWPGWSMSVKLDNTTYNKVRRSKITIMSGNTLTNPIASATDPQNVTGGPLQITGDLDILVDGIAERGKWTGPNAIKMELTWDTPWKLTASSNVGMTATLENAYVETYNMRESDGQYLLSLGTRSVITNASQFNLTLTSMLPGTAIGGASPVT